MAALVGLLAHLALLAVVLNEALGQQEANVTVISCVESKYVVKSGDSQQFVCEIEIDPFPTATQPVAMWYKKTGANGVSSDFQPVSTVHPSFNIADTTYPTPSTTRGSMSSTFATDDLFGEFEVRFASGLSQEVVYHTAMFMVEQAELPRPPSLRLNAQFHSSIKLEWVVKAGSSPLIKYEIQRRQRLDDNMTTEWRLATALAARPNRVFEVAQISALRAFSSYQFRARVQNEFGWGNYSAPSEFFTTLPNTPAPAANVVVVNTTQDSVTLQWTLSPDYTRSQGDIETYTVNFEPTNSTAGGRKSHEVKVVAGTNITVATVPGLIKGTEYVFRVVADNGFFPAKPSSPVYVKTNSSHPGNFSFVATTPISHEWVMLQLGTIDTGGSPLSKLIVHYRTLVDAVSGAESDWSLHSSMPSPSQRHLMIRGLEENSTYRFRIMVHNKNGKGRPASFSELVATKLFVPPADVSNASVVDGGPTSLTLRWAAQECPRSPGAVSGPAPVKSAQGLCPSADGLAVPTLGYTVQYRPTGASEWQTSSNELGLGLNPSVEHRVDALLQDTEYEFRVLGRNEYGESEGENVFTASTDQGRPNSPEIVDVIPMGGRVAVHWRVAAGRQTDRRPYSVSNVVIILLDEQGKELTRATETVSESSQRGSTVLSGVHANGRYSVRIQAQNSWGETEALRSFAAGTDAPQLPTSPPDIVFVTTHEQSSLSNTNLIIIIAGSVLAPTLLLIANVALICCCRKRRKTLRKRAWQVDRAQNEPPLPSPPPPAWSRSADHIHSMDSLAPPPPLATRSAWDGRVHHEAGFESTTSLPAMLAGTAHDRHGLADMDEEPAETSNIPTTFTSFGVDSPSHLPPPPMIDT